MLLADEFVGDERTCGSKSVALAYPMVNLVHSMFSTMFDEAVG